MKKILVAQPFGIGDALFVTPLLRALKEEARVERVDMILGSRTREIFETNPFVDRIFTVDMDRLRERGKVKSFFEIAGLLWELRKQGYDTFIDCSLSRRYALFAGIFLGISRRIGFNYKRRGAFLTRSLALPEGYKGKHVIEYYSEMGKLADLTVKREKPDLFLTEEDVKTAGALLAGGNFFDSFSYIAVAPGGGESWGRDAHFKRWSPEFFAELINKLSHETGIDGVVILGSRNEFNLGEQVLTGLKKPGFNLCGLVPVRQSAAILKKARFLLANDSGMVHMSRALEVPAIALYGPVDEKVYGPYPLNPGYLALGRSDLECRPCYRNFRYNAACAGRECLTGFYPDEVFQKIISSGFLKQFKTAVNP